MPSPEVDLRAPLYTGPRCIHCNCLSHSSSQVPSTNGNNNGALISIRESRFGNGNGTRHRFQWLFMPIAVFASMPSMANRGIRNVDKQQKRNIPSAAVGRQIPHLCSRGQDLHKDSNHAITASLPG
eukprot:6426962-Amphidinium_carterae.1